MKKGPDGAFTRVGLVAVRAGRVEAPLLTRERHRQVLTEAIDHLVRAEQPGLSGWSWLPSLRLARVWGA